MTGHPIDDFLSELDNVYRHYDAFIASLPRSLQTLAASEKRLSARTMNRVYLLFPFWFADGLGLGREVCQAIACGNVYGLLYYLSLDWMIDADKGLGNEWLLLADLFYTQSIQCCLSVIPAGTADCWWARLRELMTQYAQGVLWEKGCYSVEDEFADPDILLALRGAMSQICGYTLALASGRDEGPALMCAIKCFDVGWAIQDDIRDWQQDGQHGLYFNALLQLASSDQGGSIRWEHIEAALEKSRVYLTEAKHCVAHLRSCYWDSLLDHLIEENCLLKNKLVRKLYQSVVVHSGA
jgi:hypothetical protein